jgi:hypothetical protein
MEKNSYEYTSEQLMKLECICEYLFQFFSFVFWEQIHFFPGHYILLGEELTGLKHCEGFIIKQSWGDMGGDQAPMWELLSTLHQATHS